MRWKRARREERERGVVMMNEDTVDLADCPTILQGRLKTSTVASK